MPHHIAIRTLVTLVLLFACGASSAKEGLVVFYLDEHYQPTVRLDRIQPHSEGVKAILALYALENGAGCEGKNERELVNCALTKELGLGANCSADHIALVRTWFDITPNLTSRWNERWNKETRKAGSLEALCYSQPDTASWHNIWEIIRISTEGEVVTVEAVQAWGSQFGHGRVRYKHSYQVLQGRVKEVSAEVTELQRSSKSIFESEAK